MPDAWDELDALLDGAADSELPVLAARALMRALPALAPRLRPEAHDGWHREVLALFRALFVADAVLRHGGNPDIAPDQLRRLPAALSDATIELSIAADRVDAAGQSAFADLRAAAGALLTCMASDGADRRRAAARAVRLAGKLSPWPDEERIAFKLDISVLKVARGPFAVARLPLWTWNYPSAVVRGQRAFLTAVAGFHWSWSVWMQWYAARLGGIPGFGLGDLAQGRLIDMDIAAFSDTDWSDTARAVNLRIDRVIRRRVGAGPLSEPLVFFDGRLFDIMDGAGKREDLEMDQLFARMSATAEALVRACRGEGMGDIADLFEAYRRELGQAPARRSTSILASLGDMLTLLPQQRLSKSADRLLGQFAVDHEAFMKLLDRGLPEPLDNPPVPPDFAQAVATAAKVEAMVNRGADHFSGRLAEILLLQASSVQILAAALAGKPAGNADWSRRATRLLVLMNAFCQGVYSFLSNAATLGATQGGQIDWYNAGATISNTFRQVVSRLEALIR